MPRARDMPRYRLRRIVLPLAAIGTILAVVLVGGGIYDAFAGHHGAVAEIVWGAIVAIALGLLWRWAEHTMPAAAARDAAEAPVDGLPYGAYRDGGRVGLPTTTAWSVFVGAYALVVVGAIPFSIADLYDDISALRLAAVATVFGVLALAGVGLFSYICGTVWWLDDEGAHRERWPRKSVRWPAVTDVTASSSMAPVGQNVRVPVSRVELIAPGGVRTARGGTRNKLVISTRMLEIADADLVDLIGVYRAADRQPVGDSPRNIPSD